MSRVLIVDDEDAMRRILGVNLRARRYDVDLAATGEEALALAERHPPDVVVLDLGLPGMDGVEVIRRLRAWSTAPILVLSGRELEADKVEALDAGADDYVTKPFGLDELLARLRAALRRSAGGGAVPEVVDTPDFRVDLSAKTVSRPGGTAVHLTPIEWQLLEALVRQEGALVGHRPLLQEVWGPRYGDETNYLRVHMANLRRKLEPDPSRPRYLLTEAGRGYRFVVPG